MRARAIGLLAAVGIGAVAASAPSFAPTIARKVGVSVGSASWCREGVCLLDVSRGETTANAATLGWSGVLTLHHVKASLAEGSSGTGGNASIPIRAVMVDDLVIRGTPLPSLNGEVWPRRSLVGEGVTVDGDTVRATVPTEYGEVRLTVDRVADGYDIDAACLCSVKSASLSSLPLSDRRVRARGQYAAGHFSGTITLERVPIRVEADRGEGTNVSGSFSLDGVPIADVVDALAPVVPEAARATISGTLTGTGTFATPDAITFVPHIEGFTVDGLVSSTLSGGRFTYPGRDETGATVLVSSGEGSDDWLSLEAIGPMLPAAVVACEDAGFWHHAGYDLDGMVAAAADNRDRGHIVRGGSTLSQQLAKNLFLDGERTYARKVRELLYAVEMERELHKQRIMALYLNIVEWGPAVRGARAAANAYFAKSPSGLLPEEAAFLASILRNPRTAWERQYRKERPDTARIAFILDGMRDLSDEARAAALARPIHLVPQ